MTQLLLAIVIAASSEAIRCEHVGIAAKDFERDLLIWAADWRVELYPEAWQRAIARQMLQCRRGGLEVEQCVRNLCLSKQT